METKVQERERSCKQERHKILQEDRSLQKTNRLRKRSSLTIVLKFQHAGILS